MATRIMVVDDSAFMRMIIKDILSKGGYEIIAEASNGIQAVELYLSHKPDIVLMDISMPYMNGLEAVNKIFKINQKANIIICSAQGEEHLILSALRAGVFDFIVKPFKSDRIIKAIEKLLASL